MDVLRKALIVATKLKINDFKEWVENELGGYLGKKVPPYRVISGQPTVFQVYTGRHQPMMFESQETRDSYSTFAQGQTIAEIEQFATKDGRLAMDYSAELQMKMNEENAVPVGRYCCIFDQTAFIGILNQVRDIVLKWALKLEDEGILGEGMTFSAEEKATAAKSSSVHIGAVYGQVRMNDGSTDNSTNTVNINPSTVFNEIRQAVEQVTDKGERDQALATINAIETAPSKKAGIEKLAMLMSLTANSVKVYEATITYVPWIVAFVRTLAS